MRKLLRSGFIATLCVLATTLPVRAIEQDSSPFIASTPVRVAPEDSSGSFSYSYPISVPPGRNAMQPNISLSYNSGVADDASITGYGWSPSIPKIERVNKRGVDKLYNRHDFTSSLGGELVDVLLSDGSHGTYAVKVENGNFLTYVYNTNETWTVTDMLGTQYTFGGSSNSRVIDPANSSHVFSWYLTETRDTNDNVVTYSYSSTNNQVYPSNINYTGHANTAGIFDIAFTLEASSTTNESFATGFSVKTGQRISAITVKVNNTNVRIYDINYTVGDNTTRPLLSSITETGIDEASNSITKPATTFTYSASHRTWTEDTTASIPIAIAAGGASSIGTFVFDVNGDSLPDIVKSLIIDNGGTPIIERGVYLNDGNNNWVEDAGYTIPVYFAGNGYDQGVRIADFNGDGYQDILKARRDQNTGVLYSEVYINDGDGTGWTQDTTVVIPTAFDNSTRIFDVNGDGLPDIVYGRMNQWTAAIESEFYINNGDGTGWTLDGNYVLPINISTEKGKDAAFRTADVNGDGLTDLLQAVSTTNEVYINKGNGTGWIKNTSYVIPATFLATGKDTGTRLLDINGDGLTDVFHSRLDSTGNPESNLYINRGGEEGWVEDTNFQGAPVAMTTSAGADRGVREDNFSGSMLTDFMHSVRTGTPEVLYTYLFVQDGGRGDLLTSVSSTSGATTDVAYTSSTVPNPSLPFSLQVVDTITTDDGFGNVSTQSYTYENGSFYYNNEYDRKFAGFGKVTTTDGLGNVTISYYHQGNTSDSAHGEATDDVSKLLHRYREEQYDSNGNLYRTTIDTWVNTDIGNGRDFVYKTQTLVMDYDGDADHRDTAVRYTYNTNNGNLVEKIEYGLGTGNDNGSFTDSGTDDRTTAYAYAQWTSGESGYLASETLTDHVIDTIRRTTRFYDGNTTNAVSIGNVTREVKKISATENAETNFAYDAYGFRTAVIDANGNTTTITPDAVELYPASVTNDLSQVTEYVYDYSSGKVIETTDANGFISQTVLDGFDRPITEKKPNPSSPASLLNVRTFSYDDVSFPSSIHESDLFDGLIQKETYTYFDGFSRPVQTREEAASSYSVIDTAYDERGDVKKASLPYSSAGSGHTSPTTTVALYETYARDALHRLTSKTNAAGSTVTSYDEGISTETDAENNTKKYHWDGFGRLESVIEVIDATELETSYEYDAAGNLTGLTDAENNIRTFAYNGLGNRTAMTDLHASGDIYFGEWSYGFDPLGNMIQAVSPNGVTTTYAYDELNRLKTENASGTSGTDLTYTYDSCTNGVGKRCSAAVLGGATTAYTYDALGRTATEVKTISGIGYTTAYAYDRQNNVSTVTYPDTSTATYALNSAGQITSAAFDDVHGAPVTEVSSITYGPHGKVTAATYGNGVTSTWSYDAAELYRLQNKTTTSGTNGIENFIYGYDNVGNLATLADASSLYGSLAITYGYDDLYRLTGADSVSADSALDYTKTWSYTDIGNIVSSSDKGSYTYGGTASGNYANPHAPTHIGSSTTLTYDYNGNMTGDGTWTNTWDHRNQLLTSVDGTTTVTYQYDDAGNRVVQDGSGATRIYPNSYYSVDGSNVDRNILVGALGSVATSNWNGTVDSITYHHTDHLGGTHIETNENGATVEYIIYSPFGGTLVDVKTGAYENKNKYTGKEKDIDTGWYYYGARYYNAENGVFLSEDPVFLNMGTSNHESEQKRVLTDPQLGNSYAYARENPITYVDPNGEFIPVLVAGLLAMAPEIATTSAIIASGVGVAVLGNALDVARNPNSSMVERLMAGADVAGIITPFGATERLGTQGFRSFTAFKRFAGAAGEGRQWHHIVEQSASNIERFGGQAIHSTDNLISLPKEIHQQVSGYYSSKIPELTGNQTVREWLRPQSFEKQVEFGKRMLDKFTK
ncbi:MAG: SpvB/TcaC N-terminal domain-containing protein [Patescibacteria group bacterium]|jgi:RHS repeat-associated protein